MSAGADVHAATNASAGGATALTLLPSMDTGPCSTLIDAADISTNIAFVNVRDGLGALHLAAGEGSQELVSLLLERGADVRSGRSGSHSSA